MNAQAPIAERFWRNSQDLEAAVFSSLLNSLSASLFILEASGKIAYVNQSAEKHLATGTLLSMSGRHVMARKSVGWENLSQRVADAARENGDRSRLPKSVSLFDSDGRRAFAFLAPLGCPQNLWSVFITFRAEEKDAIQNSLRYTFDLTPMEAKVAAMIAKGERPQAIADALAVSVNTVRTHLKNAFAKTETGSQSALAAVVNDVMPPVTVCIQGGVLDAVASA